jgi:transposase
MENSTTETIGCDLGDKMSEVCVLSANGSQQRMSLRTTRAAMRLFFTRSPAHVVIEVGGHSRWVSGLLTELGHRVTVANARRVQLISQSNNKTDQHDAELLARLGRADVGLLSPVVHRKPETQAHLAVAKARDVLVATRTRLVNHVRGTVKSFGDRIPKCRAETFGRHTRELVPELLKAALDPIYDALDVIEKKIRDYDKTIDQVAERYPDVAVVSQVAGVGTLTGLVYVLTLEDKHRFSKSRMVGRISGCDLARACRATTTRSFESRRQAIRFCVACSSTARIT